ncbi:hypothetical protein ElyMa_004666300 [Elysia marginata]|uniref:Alpha-type protein kinase domain-containing protein n=1 Tax=Elysia marginata TaxID=1093978 RepID=A0AAV4I5Q7_9GAST|nr:hypothetical protein ElyMa_004666300 [Elysia marginata]
MDSSFGAVTDRGPAMMRRVFHQHVCNNLCYSYERPLQTDHTGRENQEENTCKGEDYRTNERQPSLEPITPTDPGSSSNGQDVLQADKTTGLTIMVNDGEMCRPVNELLNQGFTKGENTSDDLAHCGTELSRCVMVEIEKNIRRAVEKSDNSESKEKKNHHDVPSKIILGDQLKMEENTEGHKKHLNVNVPTHRCDVHIIGSIKKRPSI